MMKLGTWTAGTLSLVMAVTAVIAATAGCTSSGAEPTSEVAATQESEPLAIARDNAARSSLETLRHVMENQKSIGPLVGNAPAGNLDGATVGNAIPMRMVRLDSLRAYRSGDDPRALLLDRGAYMYPVSVGGEAHSSFVLRQVNGRWTPSSFGRTGLIKQVLSTRNSIASASPLQNGTLVEIPALHLRFMGHDQNGELLLTPLQDVEGTSLRSGNPEKAAGVLTALVPIAQRLQEMPAQ